MSLVLKDRQVLSQPSRYAVVSNIFRVIRISFPVALVTTIHASFSVCQPGRQDCLSELHHASRASRALLPLVHPSLCYFVPPCHIDAARVSSFTADTYSP